MSQLDDFRRQIGSLPALVETEVPRLEPLTRTALSTPEIYGLRQIVLAGSGDSYFAGVAAAHLLRRLTGLPVQAMISMEASRYAGALGAAQREVGARGVLVICVSYSGEAARLVEAAQRWRASGAITLGVTAKANGRLAQSAERWIDSGVDEVAPAPGTRTYVASLLCLYLLSIRIAEVLMRITMDEANALRRALAATSGALLGLDERCAPRLEELARAWSGARSVDVLGSGPSLASAAYAAAKLVEAAGVHAVAQDAEEFFHLNYFADRPDEIPTLLFAPSNAACASRASELAPALAQLGRPYVVVTDSPDLAGEDNAIILPAVEEAFAPIMQTVPAALFAAYSAHARGAVHYRDHDGAWTGARGAGLVRNSKIELADV